MTRLLIVGGGGMLGHKLWQLADTQIETWATVRQLTPALRAIGLGRADRTIENLDVRHPGSLESALDRARPDVVINCVGIVKQLEAAKDPVESITINSLHPHLLARACAAHGIRLIHISTDCVFDGQQGRYKEQDVPNATDLYGRSKALGETMGPGALTVRTSIIGRELSGSSGLVEWFLSRRGGVADGFARAVFSGFTTLALAGILLRILAEHPTLEGLYHVAAAPIDKHTLLSLMNEAYGAGVTITPRNEPCVDRSLDGAHFARATCIAAPDWNAMIADMAADTTPYDNLRRNQDERR